MMKRALLLVAMALVTASVAFAGGVHHVVGGDRGWDPSSGVGSWSSGRTFRVGDKIWFAYSAAQESVAELRSREEYESCDVSNPIRMYTDGLDGVSLHAEGIRYFASSSAESCKNGLKLHVEVLPQPNQDTGKADLETTAAAAAPTTPSTATHVTGVSSLLLAFGFWVYYSYMGVIA